MSFTAYNLPRNTYNSSALDTYAWPGGYPIYYLTGDNATICPKCANRVENEYRLELLGDMCNWCIDPEYDPMSFVDELPKYADVNYEDDNKYCEDCGQRIECAYGEAMNTLTMD